MSFLSSSSKNTDSRSITASQISSEYKPRILWAVALVMLLAHCALLLVCFGGPRSLLSDQPLIYLDHSWHFYYSILSSRFLVEHGTTWGYDPFLMAGYPTEVMDTSDRLIKVLMVPLHLLGLERGYKICVFLMSASAPLLFFAAALWLGLKSRTVIISTILGTLVWWAGGGLYMLTMGMTGFSLASIYGIALAGLFSRYLSRPGRSVSIALIIAAPLGLLIHPGIVPIAAAPCLVFYIIYFKKLSLSRHLFILFLCFFTLAANLFWILPFTQNLVFGTPSNMFFQNPFDFITFIRLRAATRFQAISPALSLLALLAAAGAGSLSLNREGRKDLAFAFGFLSFVLFFIFLFGSSLSLLRDTQPTRYWLPLLFTLVFPAAPGLENWARLVRWPVSPRIRSALFLSALAFCLCLLYKTTAIVAPFAGLSKNSFVGMEAKVSWTRDWISANTDRSARVLIEDNSSFDFVYGNNHASSVLAWYTGRELIGGPLWATNLKNHFADLSGLRLFGQLLVFWDEQSLSEYMDLYNIGWVGASSPPVRDLFDAHPALFKPIGEAGGFQFYVLPRRHTFFIEGSGEVKSDYNRLLLRNVPPGLSRVVISYHWHPRLRVKPPAKIERVMIGRDPVGFIGIINPQPEMIIETNYWGKN